MYFKNENYLLNFLNWLGIFVVYKFYLKCFFFYLFYFEKKKLFKEFFFNIVFELLL